MLYYHFLFFFIFLFENETTHVLWHYSYKIFVDRYWAFFLLMSGMRVQLDCKDVFDQAFDENIVYFMNICVLYGKY